MESKKLRTEFNRLWAAITSLNNRLNFLQQLIQALATGDYHFVDGKMELKPAAPPKSAEEVKKKKESK